MDKKNFWLVAVVVVVVLLFTLKGINLTFNPITFASYSQYSDGNDACTILFDEKTNGAGEGECFISGGRVNYVSSALLNYNPNAYKDYICKVETCYSCDNIFTCDVAKTTSGEVKVCKSNNECESKSCVNNYCKEGLPSGGCTQGQKRCFDINNAQECLVNGMWSGKEPCSSSQTCSNGICITSTSSSSSSGGTTCTPKTCSQLGAECGSISNGCGGMIACGGCISGKTCSSNQCINAATTCDADTCSSLDLECGSWSNGCSGTINCGSCTGTKVCELGLCVSPADVTNQDDVVDDTDNVVDGNINDGNAVPTDGTTVSAFDFNKVLFNIGDFEVKLWMLIIAIILLIVILAVVK